MIFLTASAEARARRRYDEQIARCEPVVFETVLADIIERDHRDSTRAIAPLKQSADAILVDTTEIDFDQSLELLLNTIRERI